jgi:hypothetical protein
MAARGLVVSGFYEIRSNYWGSDQPSFQLGKQMESSPEQSKYYRSAADPHLGEGVKIDRSPLRVMDSLNACCVKEIRCTWPLVPSPDGIHEIFPELILIT